MQGNMHSGNMNRLNRLMRWTTWLCLSLMLWAAAVEPTHQHPSGSDNASCSLCVVAHSSRPAASSGHARPVFGAVDFLHAVDVTAHVLLASSELGIRGPP